MKTLVFLSLSMFLITCKTSINTISTKSISEYTGLIERQGITSYQYGTHTLKTEDALFALKSETIDLNDYVGKTIKLTAETVDGYPVDNGPDYLNVTSIKQ